MTLIVHDLTAADAQAMQSLRSALAAMPKLKIEPPFRDAYDQIIGQVPPPEGVAFEAAIVGGVPGYWARPQGASDRSAILYLHGGGYVLGTAAAYRNFVGHIAKGAGAAAFIADYALAPEHPFPAAFEDADALMVGLEALGYRSVALCGDSAGGGLVLGRLTTSGAGPSSIVAAVALSPWLDMAGSGDSMRTRADQDPILSPESIETAARQFLAGRPADDPRLNPLGADLRGLPPIRIHVGDAEVLLDDSLRFEKKAAEAGLDCEVHVWEGMVHVFPTNLAVLQASAAALQDVGAFLAQHLGARAGASQ